MAGEYNARHELTHIAIKNTHNAPSEQLRAAMVELADIKGVTVQELELGLGEMNDNEILTHFFSGRASSLHAASNYQLQRSVNSPMLPVFMGYFNKAGQSFSGNIYDTINGLTDNNFMRLSYNYVQGPHAGVKTETQIANMRTAGQIMEQAVENIRQRLNPRGFWNGLYSVGLREGELRRLFVEEVERLGGEYGVDDLRIIQRDTTLSAEKSASTIDYQPTGLGRHVFRGDEVLIDAVLEIGGERFDSAYSFVVGGQNSLQNRALAAIDGSMDLVLHRLANRGEFRIQKYEDLFPLGKLEIEEQRLGKFGYWQPIHRQFGADGLHSFSLGHFQDRSALEGLINVGDVINIEPGVYMPGSRGFRKEIQLLITRDGYEILGGGFIPTDPLGSISSYLKRQEREKKEQDKKIEEFKVNIRQNMESNLRSLWLQVQDFATREGVNIIPGMSSDLIREIEIADLSQGWRGGVHQTFVEPIDSSDLSSGYKLMVNPLSFDGKKFVGAVHFDLAHDILQIILENSPTPKGLGFSIEEQEILTTFITSKFVQSQTIGSSNSLNSVLEDFVGSDLKKIRRLDNKGLVDAIRGRRYPGLGSLPNLNDFLGVSSPIAQIQAPSASSSPIAPASVSSPMAKLQAPKLNTAISSPLSQQLQLPKLLENVVLKTSLENGIPQIALMQEGSSSPLAVADINSFDGRMLTIGNLQSSPVAIAEMAEALKASGYELRQTPIYIGRYNGEAVHQYQVEISSPIAQELMKSEIRSQKSDLPFSSSPVGQNWDQVYSQLKTHESLLGSGRIKELSQHDWQQVELSLEDIFAGNLNNRKDIRYNPFHQRVCSQNLHY